MIFGAAPALISNVLAPVVQQKEQQKLLAKVNDPNAPAAEKQAAYDALQKLAPTPPPPPGRITADFFAENKTALLVGGGLALAGGVGYWLWKRRRGRRR